MADARPPQRLSARVGHPWHDPYWAGRVDVLVNGERRERVVTADGIEGWAEIHRDPPLIVGGQMQTLRLRGKVEIVRQDRPSAQGQRSQRWRRFWREFMDGFQRATMALLPAWIVLAAWFVWALAHAG